VSGVHRLEFTIEPFEEGRPGAHVTAPVDVLRGRGYDVEFGPFGSACDVPAGEVADAVAAVVAAAFEYGATHVNVDVAAPERA
jgi:uncharacterized protein YqgV (UPF0045/DUF77 family)